MTDDRFYDLDISETEAARFQVEPRIHKDDFIFMYHFEGHDNRPMGEAAAAYLSDGAYSTAKLDAVITEFLPDRTGISILEFASGYGCLTRHLKKLDGKYAVTSCDIHPQAVDFIKNVIGVDAVLSDPVPEKLSVGRRFDVVFALSFFSHMPPQTFKRWVNALLDQVNDQGILIFTTHGTCGQGRINVATLGEEGCWFAPLSEQKDLPTSDYGTMLVRPHYVFDTVGHRTDYALRFFQEAHWWGVQDTYIFQKFDNGQAAGLHPTPHARDIAALQAAIAALQSDLAAQTKQSQLSLNALKSENDSLMAAIARNAQLHADELGKLQNSIEEIRSSTSWRVTAPVRKLVETIRGH